MQSFRNVDVDALSFCDTLVRDGAVYVAALDPPLTVGTTTVTMASGIVEDSFAHIKVGGSLLEFFKAVERKVQDTAVAKKAGWFREDISDELISSSFKTFVTDSTVKVRVSDDVAAFNNAKAKIDLPGAGARVKAVLELARVTFGKTQFGLVWTLRQVKCIGESVYLFDDDVAETVAEGLDDSTILATHEDCIDADIA